MAAMDAGRQVVHVLLVEDNPDDVEIIRARAEEDDCRALSLRVCGSLAKALKAVREPGLDLVLLDLGLPDSTGIETFKRFHAAVPKLPVIVLTGQADAHVSDTCMALGAHDYVVKGETGGYITGRIHNTVARLAAQRAAAEAYENLERVLADSHDAILVLGENNIVRFANRAAQALFSGRETAERIQAQRPGIKVLYASGHGRDQITDRRILEPGVPFIQKPFKVADLTATVRQILGAPALRKP